VLPLHHTTISGSSWTRTNELERGKIYSLLPLPLGDTPKIRKGEDGCVDDPFYDWHYSGVFLPTPMIPTEIHSRVIDITIPQSTFCTHGRNRTYDLWFWRPLLFQLSYTRVLSSILSYHFHYLPNICEIHFLSLTDR
jgi:hypothetical protein